MLSHNVQFIEANKNRKIQYRTNLQIYPIHENPYLIKSADNPKAIEFLKTIIDREKIAKTFFSQYAEVVTGTLKDGRIFYPYLNYPTLEQLIGEAIDNRHRDFGASIIEKYIQFIQNLSTRTCYPTEFLKRNGVQSGHVSRKLNCLAFGPIDCIPCNILVSTNRWHIIDHEWTYDFPTPSAYIIFRAIYSLTIRLQKKIQRHVSQKQPVSLLSGYGNNRTYIPYEWLGFIPITEVSIENLAYWEWKFQSKIRLNVKPGRFRLKKEPKALFAIKQLSPFVLGFVSFCTAIRKHLVRYLTMVKQKLYPCLLLL